jgi:hypothetical protein
VLFCPHLEDCPYSQDGRLPSPGQPCCQRGAAPSAPPADS